MRRALGCKTGNKGDLDYKGEGEGLKMIPREERAPAVPRAGGRLPRTRTPRVTDPVFIAAGCSSSLANGRERRAQETLYAQGPRD